jgi:hypothetical protein
MAKRKATIRFGTCPLDDNSHKGEIWAKLQRRDLTKDAVLVDIKYLWDNEMSIEEIRNDTFSDFTYEDWRLLMQKFYGGPVFGILLTFDHPNGKFTTFRAYDWKKSNWYSNSLGKVFKIVVAGLNDGVSFTKRRPKQIRKLKEIPEEQG